MEVTVSIPDKFIPPTVDNSEVSRQMLEAYAIEGYRQESLSIGQIAEILDFSIDETNAFLKEHKVALNYNFEDLDADAAVVELFLAK